jgi:pimeloyl-ACP methyl ester carboxylesterase
MLDVAQDIRSLADHLRLDDFALSGMSGGTPFVLAAAWAFQGRVTGAAIACGLGPLDRPGALEGMRAANVETFEVARAAPEQLAQILEGRDLVAAMPEEDGAALETMPHLAELLLESAIEATRQGWSGAVADYSAFVMPWGFDLSEIGTPFSLWHGDQDRLVPIHHSEFVASELRSAVLTTCPGQGHLAMFGHFEEMFECLTTV